MISKLMDARDINDALELLSEFSKTEHYSIVGDLYGKGGDAETLAALRLFDEKPYLGGVWLTKVDENFAAVSIFSFAISTALGRMVAKLDDVYVRPEFQRLGVGTKHLENLKDFLRLYGVARIDTSVHNDNEAARKFYDKCGFKSLNETKLTCLI